MNTLETRDPCGDLETHSSYKGMSANTPNTVPKSSALEEALRYAEEITGLVESPSQSLEATKNSNELSEVAIEEEAKDIVDSKNSSEISEGHEIDTYSFSKTERNIIDLALRGRAPGVISAQLNLPQSFVRGFLLRKDTKDYLRELKEAKSQLIQLKALDIFSDIIDARVDQLEESGGSYAELSRKDTVDILRAAVELASGIDKSREKADEGDVYVNILQQVMR